jgi:hypothetical protein
MFFLQVLPQVMEALEVVEQEVKGVFLIVIVLEDVLTQFHQSIHGAEAVVDSGIMQ